MVEHRRMNERGVPVLLLNGPVGAGKSTVGAEAARMLRAADVPHAFVDLAVIGQCWPVPADDPWHERLIHRNLAGMWSNFREAGAERLIVCRVLEDRSLLRQVRDAVPGAEVTVVGLRVRPDLLYERIRRREAGRDPAWYLAAAARLSTGLERSGVDDEVVDNGDRPVHEVAGEVLDRLGWPR
jgi:chloramphenicol 3-O-phosphotransferase